MFSPLFLMAVLPPSEMTQDCRLPNAESSPSASPESPWCVAHRSMESHGAFPTFPLFFSSFFFFSFSFHFCYRFLLQKPHSKAISNVVCPYSSLTADCQFCHISQVNAIARLWLRHCLWSSEHPKFTSQLPSEHLQIQFSI